jgi:hypothetical protein
MLMRQWQTTNVRWERLAATLDEAHAAGWHVHTVLRLRDGDMPYDGDVRIGVLMWRDVRIPEETTDVAPTQ